MKLELAVKTARRHAHLAAGRLDELARPGLAVSAATAAALVNESQALLCAAREIERAALGIAEPERG